MPRRKYGNKITYIGDMRFDSKAEAGRWMELRAREMAGEICLLERQPKRDLIVAGKKVGSIKGDFRYIEGARHTPKSRPIIEDVKGARTRDFALRWKLAQALYPNIDWRIVEAKDVRVT